MLKREYFSAKKLATTDEAFSDREVLKTEIYNDYLRSLNIFYGIGVEIQVDADTVLVAGGWHSRAQGPFGEPERRLLRVLAPHIKSAMHLHRCVAKIQLDRDAAAGALDRLPYGVFLFDERLQVSFVNRLGRALLESDDGLRLVRGELGSSSSDETKALRGLLKAARDAAAGESLKPGGVMKLSRPTSRRPLEIAVTPLPASTHPIERRRPRVVLFVTIPERTPDVAGRLAELHGLSRAEARLAVLLMQGLTVKEAADHLGVSSDTVRSQLKSIFAKTNTSRQSTLMRLLFTGPLRGC